MPTLQRVHASHSTNSVGKLNCQEFQAPFWKSGNSAVLVGSGEAPGEYPPGLVRHVEYFRSAGTKIFHGIEMMQDTYLSLIRAQEKYYANDPAVCIHHCKMQDFDFQQYKIVNIDYDACTDWIRHFYWLRESAELSYITDLDFLFKNQVSTIKTISCTFTQRTLQMDKIRAVGKVLNVEQKSKQVWKTVPTQDGLKHKQVHSIDYIQADVAQALFSKMYPEFKFNTFSYQGVNTGGNGIPMLTIVGVKKYGS